MGIPRCSRCLQRRAIAVIILLVHALRGLRAVTDRLFRAARSILTASCFVILRPGGLEETSDTLTQVSELRRFPSHRRTFSKI
jgi:hypothetical protein